MNRLNLHRFSAPKSWITAALLLAAFGTPGDAQILRLDLPQMVAQTDGGIFGTIIHKETIRIDHPIDGPELYYTTLTIKGERLSDQQEATILVSYPGGFVDPDNGVYNSEEPAADVAMVGKRVVAFHKWSDNMGGDFASSALYASHGGIYPTFEDSRGQVIVQGRGDGYAVRSNTHLARLQHSVAQLKAEQPR